MLDVQEGPGQAAAQALGGNAGFIRCDVTSESEVRAAMAAARDQMGSINLLVNCAGVIGAGRLVGKTGPMATEVFTKTIHINLIGTFRCIANAALGMVDLDPLEDGERGVIINTASVAAEDGQIGQAAYSASKGGVLAMTLPIARDLMNEGVRVNVILPGVFKTPMVAMMPQNVQDALGAQVPFPKRLGEAEEYARLALFLIENVYMNAASVRLDGGIRMAPR
jgi:NAD(P)-dependent dehydrogenase (short-subunit alcohol dehydrogenase family)